LQQETIRIASKLQQCQVTILRGSVINLAFNETEQVTHVIVQHDSQKIDTLPCSRFVAAAGPWTQQCQQFGGCFTEYLPQIEGLKAHSVVVPVTVAATAIFVAMADGKEREYYPRPSGTGEYSKQRRSNVAVIHVRIVFICSFLFYCLLLNHIFPTNPNKITNCLKLILSIYNFTTTLLLRRYFDFCTVYICGEGNEDSEIVTELPGSVTCTSSSIDAMKKDACKLYAALDVDSIRDAACHLPVVISATGNPIIGEIGRGTNCYVGCGHTCWGILQGPGTGKALAELIATGSCSCLDLSAFRVASKSTI